MSGNTLLLNTVKQTFGWTAKIKECKLYVPPPSQKYQDPRMLHKTAKTVRKVIFLFKNRQTTTETRTKNKQTKNKNIYI